VDKDRCRGEKVCKGLLKFAWERSIVEKGRKRVFWGERWLQKGKPGDEVEGDA